MAPFQTGVAVRRFRPRLIVVGVLCLIVGLTVRYFIDRAGDVPSYLAPAERVGRNAPFITSPDLVVEKMIELAALEETDLVYDLGCGDGRIVVTAAIRSGCTGVGFDIDPQRVEQARAMAEQHGVGQRVRIVEQDIFTIDLSEADVAMMYLLPWMMNKLLPQFQRMKPGSRIVSHDFWIDGVEPEEVCELVGRDKPTSIYVYRAPLVVDPSIEKGRPPRPRQAPRSRASERSYTEKVTRRP